MSQANGLVIYWVWCWVGNGLLVDLVRRVWLGLASREEIVQHMGKSVSALLHYLRPLVQHQVGFSPGNGDLLCKAETAGLSSSFVRVGDADRLPGDAGVFTQQLPLPKVMGQCGVVLLTDVGKGGSVAVEPQLECDGSLSNVLLGLITTHSLGFVDKGWNLAPSLKRTLCHTPSAVAARLRHVHLLLHQLGVVGLDVELHVGASGVADLHLLCVEELVKG